MRVDDAACNGPDRYCSPRRRTLFNWVQSSVDDVVGNVCYSLLIDSTIVNNLGMDETDGIELMFMNEGGADGSGADKRRASAGDVDDVASHSSPGKHRRTWSWNMQWAGPGKHSSPRHRVACNTITEGLVCCG